MAFDFDIHYKPKTLTNLEDEVSKDGFISETK